ncbi:MAG: nucleotidyltransferase domain-containing protein [Mariprofundaceae bacterium]|nr:nucleotidyltransferase domain-containing protein [Mariprofundaceae bacterium]
MSAHKVRRPLMQYLQQHPEIKQAILFGSLARNCAHAESDVDLAIALENVLDSEDKQRFLEDIGVLMGRPVDLVDLKTVGEPLLGQILQHGKRLVGNDAMYGDLLSKHAFLEVDFIPLRQRILDERRLAWIG